MESNSLNSLVKIYNKNANTILHIITAKDKEQLEDKIHIYYCLINFIIPILKNNINETMDDKDKKLDNNYLIRMGIKNNLINNDFDIIENENIDICIFDINKVDEIMDKLEKIYLRITNRQIKTILDIGLGDDIELNNIINNEIENTTETEIKKKNVKDKKMRRENVSVNEMDKMKNTCEYCNKEFKNLGAIPKHEEKCKKRK